MNVKKFFKKVFHLINIKEMKIKVPMKFNFVTYQSVKKLLT